MALAGLALVAVVILVSVGVRARARRLERLRARWGAAIDRPRRIDLVHAAHRSRMHSALAPIGVLDDRTWQDLDLDAVFVALDRTESTLGQQALYHRLRTAPCAARLSAFEALVHRFAVDPLVRERAQLALSRLQDPHGYDLWWLGDDDVADRLRSHPVYLALSASTVAAATITCVAPAWLPLLVTLLVVNILVRYLTDARVTAASAALRQVAPTIAAGERLAFLCEDTTEGLIGSLRNDGPALGRLKNIARWVSGDPLMLSVRPGAWSVLASDVLSVAYEYLNLLLLLDVVGMRLAAGMLHARGAALLRFVAAVGEVDAALAIASFRSGRQDWVTPRFAAPSSPVRITDMRHPLLDAAVPNSIVLRGGEGTIVSGSNMSGKSTFLRTVGVTAVMAQTVHTALATEYSAPVLRVRACIGMGDDLLAGRSYYIAEVDAVLDLVETSADGDAHLFLIDELFRGTNAVERIAAGEAVLRELVTAATGRKPHHAVVATHDAELVDLVADVYAPAYFGDDMTDAGLVFDYRIKPGRASTRNAIALLKHQGAPDRVVQAALARAAELDRLRGVSSSAAPPNRSL